jgi:type II secretory pathway component PulL
MNTLTDEKKEAQIEAASALGETLNLLDGDIQKLLRSRERWRKIALLCMAILAAFVVMFAVECAKLP